MRLKSLALASILFGSSLFGQTGGLSIINGTIDFSTATHTRPMIVAANVGALPASGCASGDLAIVTAATLGQQMYQNSGSGACVWTQQLNTGSSNGGGITVYSAPSVSLSGTQYIPIGGGGLPSSTETNVDTPSPSAATITNFEAQLSAPPGLGNSVAFTWRKNAVSQSLTCTISGAVATSCSDSVNSFSVSQTDLLTIQLVTTGVIAGTPNLITAVQFGTVGSNGTVNTGTAHQTAVYSAAGTAISGAGPGTLGQVLTSNGAGSDPTYQSLGGTISGLSTGKIPKAATATSLTDSLISESGSTISIAADIVTTGLGNLTVGNQVNPAVGQTFGINSRNYNAAGSSVFMGGTISNSSGQFNGFHILETYNQSGTAAATDLLINRTQTAVGSGAQKFVDYQVATVSKYSIDNTGKVTYPDATTQNTSPKHSFVCNIGSATGSTVISTGDTGCYSDSGSLTGTINRVDVIGNAAALATCSITVDVWKANAALPSSGNKISASAPATLTTATVSQSGSLSGWSTTVSNNDIWGASVATVTGCVYAQVRVEFQ